MAVMDTEFSLACAESFGLITKENLLAPGDLEELLLPTVLHIAGTSRDREVTDEWLSVLYGPTPTHAPRCRAQQWERRSTRP